MDPCVKHFVQYLEGERNASEHTINNYLMDIKQFVGLTWSDEAKPPYRWKEADRFAARKFLVFFQKLEMAPATTGRKLSALRPETVEEAAEWINEPGKKQSAEERAANLGAILAAQAHWLTERLLDRQARDFEKGGGFSERLYKARTGKSRPNGPSGRNG